MGVIAKRRIAELDGHLVLAPERYDPRRVVAGASSTTVGGVVALSTASWRGAGGSNKVLVLDTSHAFEGAVRLRHPPGEPSDVGSTKRTLAPGDVIISRLRPYLRQVAWVDPGLFRYGRQEISVVCSMEFYVLRPPGDASIAFLVPFLLSEPVQAALAASQEGGHHPRVPRQAVLSLPLAPQVVDHRAESSARVEALVSQVQSASRHLAALAGARWTVPPDAAPPAGSGSTRRR